MTMSAVSALLRALPELFTPAILRVLAKSVAITIAIFIVLGWAGYHALDHLLASTGWADSEAASAFGAILVALLAGWFLFRVVALAVLQFFADEIVISVEQRHFPATCANTRALPFRQDVSNSLRGAGRAILFNLVAAPFALILLFTAIGPAILLWFVNAVLLGRELTDMAWLRHCADRSVDSPLRAGDRFVLGGTVAALMMIPFVNIVAPVLGAAGATFLVNSRLENDQTG